ncbi:MAG TPA: D-glycero-beta-D-manno-heptose 1-phosphate adenylyltransferase [Phycisphaerales bacterium]|nr:D-glycero-beta-D-manno-heptose 1-phosphate adenylyltransferase [Phycisphaerales bacterium]
MNTLIEIVERLGSPLVALVGDFMLDRYVYGDAERISPEAPVPVLRAVRAEGRTGGAANVAAAVLALGGKVACIGAVGQDEAGDQLVSLLSAQGAGTSTLARLRGRATTVKTRYVGLAQHRHAQQMLRVDEEVSEPLSESVQGTIRAAVRSQLSACGVVALEDYDKGTLTDLNTPQIIADARAAGKAVLVDPALTADYRRYRGATLLTPNRYEASRATGVSIVDDESLERAAKQVLLIADADAVVITLDKQGAYLRMRGDKPGTIIPTRPRNVYDVTGAGDEVLAMLAVALAGGCETPQAVALANVAGGLEIERFGVVPIRRQEIVDELRRMVGLRGGKVLDRAPLADELARRRKQGEKVVFTNGCFDLLHLGHIRCLQQARELGSCLVVAVNSDASVKRLKGPGRPVIGERERAEVLAALECVDYVTIFEEDTPEPLLKLLKPDVLVKGGTTGEIVGRKLVEQYGGKVVSLGAVDGLSTTTIINRIVGAEPGQ